jgi:DNA helicase HerA-like ATPase
MQGGSRVQHELEPGSGHADHPALGRNQPVPAIEDYLEPLTRRAAITEDAFPGAVGRTMFDSGVSKDGSVTVLLPKDEIAKVATQALVRISSADERSYLGIVVAGPFAEPDGLRADANVIVTTTVRGGIFMPRYHGRVQVELLGEEVDGALVPPRFRPLPNSVVTVLETAEKAAALQAGGTLRLGTVLGDEDVEVGIPVDKKSVLPRHTAILGTTGGGKSTTIGRLLAGAQQADMAVVVLDTEGEYVHIGEQTTDPSMLVALGRRGLAPAGIPQTRLFHLAGTETANPGHPDRTEFGLSFSALSPYTVAEIVDMTEPQKERFFRALDIGKQLLRELKIFPRPGNQEDERAVLELNEFDEGYPELTLSRVIDLVGAMLAHVEGSSIDEARLYNQELATPTARSALKRLAAAAKPSSAVSWRATLGRLWRLHRLGIFDQPRHPPLDMRAFLRRGQVSIVDLSGTDSPAVNNIVIADLLRNLQRAQDAGYQWWERQESRGEPRRVLIVIEEAHEFLSADRISRMPVLFEQVSRIAKRGRKRWLGLVFVTQLPQHLPREVLGLVNSYVLHKINDETVLRSLRNVIPGIDEGLWRRLPALAPGQAVVSLTHMARPLLVAIDPAGCRLRMVE